MVLRNMFETWSVRDIYGMYGPRLPRENWNRRIRCSSSFLHVVLVSAAALSSQSTAYIIFFTMKVLKETSCIFSGNLTANGGQNACWVIAALAKNDKLKYLSYFKIYWAEFWCGGTWQQCTTHSEFKSKKSTWPPKLFSNGYN